MKSLHPKHKSTEVYMSKHIHRVISEHTDVTTTDLTLAHKIADLIREWTGENKSQKEIDEQVRKNLLQQLKDEEEQFNEGFNRTHDYYEETIKDFNKVGHLSA